jgi:hypothetical protein
VRSGVTPYTFLKVYGARLLFLILQEQTQDIIIMALHLPSLRCIAPGEACGPHTHARSHWSSQHTRVQHAARRRAGPRLAAPLAMAYFNDIWSNEKNKARPPIKLRRWRDGLCAARQRSAVTCRAQWGWRGQNEAPA